ncbi:DNA-directed RNA polymerase [Aspergillus saccharolyticus JOP 1030-1]|uniref:DNA-directed RNA polymerase n=1 Tax=Aspergillus saccharolyticus JOP 1030-1 TaxID=1450539 RepID=A0A318ZCA8_9EURO|nr:putative mitochondrial DNA-directed RNA polymerase [Aspergillus saccharolyticus JOP 1030-1]PYH43944.1 putative mitochondrial DNA-directed RNA polymerase [Aspergillus saccharolyticus JOP 1030-1]
MLSRVALRKDALARVRVAGRSVLPSPATLRLHSHSTRPVSFTNTSSAISQERPRRHSLSSNRTLATAADHAPVGQDSYLPFENSSFDSASLPGEYFDQRLSPFFKPLPRGFDATSLIIMKDALQTKPKVQKKVKGLGGDQDEMLANLDISLRVGQFDRSASLLNRLKDCYPLGSAEYRALCNRHLNEVVTHMIKNRQYDLVLVCQKFFEVDLPGSDIQPDGTTYAIMIRMALHMFEGSKRDRTVRRYWEIAKQHSCEEELVTSTVLSESDMVELIQICPSDLKRVAMVDQKNGIAGGDIPEPELLPQIKATKQTGLGLSSLQQALGIFADPSKVPISYNSDGTQEEQMRLHNQARQRQLEQDSIDSALARWRAEQETRRETGYSGAEKRLGPLLDQWVRGLEARIEEELKLFENLLQKGNPRNAAELDRMEYGIYLRALKSERIAAITILSIVGTMSRLGVDQGAKLAGLCHGIGAEFYDEVLAERSLKHLSDRGYSARGLEQVLTMRKTSEGRARWWNVRRQLEEEDTSVTWSARVKAKVGATLMGFLFDTAKTAVPVVNPETRKKEFIMQPAFHHNYQIRWGRRAGYIHLHPSVVEILLKEPPVDMLSRHLPMVCEPKPWKGLDDGAYFVYKSSLIRSTPGETLQPAYVKAALKNNGLEEIREGLRILGSTGWVINKEVFNVMVEAWNSGEATANLAALDPNFDTPPRPSPEEGYEAEKKWDRLIQLMENRKAGIHSQRCFQNFQMEIARAYLDETFYLPHNIDFRGRAYPLPPYLNQMGADNARGLLLFSEAKPLGPQGLRWLKIQLANLAGYDKASLAEREQFVMDHMDDILDSANNGLKGRRWWLKAEDPWQCLAACIELRNALRLPDPSQYLSRLPVHQDGSCNGLQHYAALGGDKAGAQQVNLEPSDRPSDVYTGVADFVKASVAREASEGNKTAQYLNGRITRKIVKQTVMTNVYGVTFMGAMKQVRKQLVDHYPDLSLEQRSEGALYIARKIFEALGSMFNGAHELQYWFGDCASRITKSMSPTQIEDLMTEAMSKENSGTIDPSKRFRNTVIWTTPLGLPVVQPYRVRSSRRISTSLQHLSIVEANADDTISARKQLQAFPPNFIHSLDATHMILSAIACNRAGLCFSAVHDSFWTHACDVDKMNELLREAFVRMHSDDVVKRLEAEFNVRYGDHLFYGRVLTTSKIGKAITSWRRSQSKQLNTKLGELFTEYKRQGFLNSEDPELQAQGRDIMTPAKIFEELGGTADDICVSSSLGETVVGHIPENPDAAARRATAGLDVDETDPALESLFGSFETEPDLPADDDKEIEKAAKSQARYVNFWLPMQFRAVPAKGSWDVQRIRDSQYFFC